VSQWQQLGSAGAQGYTSTGAGGLGFTMHDALDAKRSMVGSIPSAEYPDGYLGTIQSRREDRLLDQVKAKLNDKRYQRGVHKGEKIDARDYLWPDDQQPDRGLANQARGIKTAPIMTLTEQLTMGGRPPGLIAAAGSPLAELNPDRAAQLRHLAPNWR
jgi:hypothetical protein